MRVGPVLCVLVLTACGARACSVPVFRYALERWPPARYELLLLHREPLSKTDRDTIGQIERAARTANVAVTLADLDKSTDPDLREIWKREGEGLTLPRLVLRYPDSGPQIQSLWSGPLSSDSVPALFESPARRQIFERLTEGYAAVVVLLLSGNPQTDSSARAFLTQQLPQIASQIDLPAKTDDGPQIQSAVPLRVSFPVVELGRTAAEESLTRLLLRSEDGLDAVPGPIAFLVFGRGRALCSLHGKDLEKPGELHRSLEFLCRACSCQVKELNPGVDLLMAADWDVVFAAQLGPPPRPVPGQIQHAETRPAPVGGPPLAELRTPPPPGYHAAELTADEPRPRWRAPWLRVGTVMAAGLVIVTGLWALRSRRTPARPES